MHGQGTADCTSLASRNGGHLHTIEQARQVEILNAANLLPNLPPDAAAGQGFLGTLYPADLIMRMSAHWPPVLALEESKVVGFALLIHPANLLPEHRILITSLNQKGQGTVALCEVPV